MAGLRREPLAIVAEHRMYARLRSLYVEGERDSSFLRSLVEKEDPDVFVYEIAIVELAGVDGGGERERLIAFADSVKPHGADIAIFADADHDRLTGAPPPPSNVWLTDFRDLEGYVLSNDCAASVAQLGLGLDSDVGVAVLEQATVHGRTLALLRLLSHKMNLSLPFQSTRLHRYVDYADGILELNFQGLLTALMQNAEISLTRRAELSGRVAELALELEDIAAGQLVHGKDMFTLIRVALRKLNPDYSDAVLWMSFAREMVDTFPTLTRVVDYLERR